MNELNSALIETLKSEELQQVVLDAGEVAFDVLLNEGVLREVPILGTVVGLGKTVYNIRDILFAQKVYRFLKQVSPISTNDWAAFVAKLNESKIKTIGETVIGALEKIETPEKSDIIGRLFASYVRESIDLDTFKRLVSKVCACAMPDLNALASICNGERFDDDLIYSDLANAGLAILTVIDGNGDMPPHECYQINRHGDLLALYGFSSH